LTNASWQIQPIEPGVGGLGRGTGSVEFFPLEREDGLPFTFASQHRLLS